MEPKDTSTERFQIPMLGMCISKTGPSRLRHVTSEYKDKVTGAPDWNII